MTITSYSLYLAISIALTIWVARTLSKNGRLFLIECFDDNHGLADSVNHLLVVGFYLINLGFICHFLRLDTPPESIGQVMEALSSKIGTVLLVLGAMHFFNLYLFHRVRRSKKQLDAPAPPVPPTYPRHATTTPNH